MTQVPEWLSSRAVVEMFGVDISTVNRWARDGLIPCQRTPGGRYRFPKAEVEALRDRNFNPGEPVEPASTPNDPEAGAA